MLTRINPDTGEIELARDLWQDEVQLARDMQRPDAETRLAQLEKTIQEGFAQFLAVGSALAEIRDTKLYRSQYETFEDYCHHRWKFTRQRAYQLMSAAEVAMDLSTTVDIPNESIARVLTKLEVPEQRRLAITIAVATAPGGKLTAAWVDSTVDVLIDAVNTGGLVDTGTGDWSAMNAAITNEAHKKMIEKRTQLAAGKQKPLTTFVLAGKFLGAFAPQGVAVSDDRQYRIVVYEVAPDGARSDAR